MVVCEDIEQSSISFMHIHKAVKLLAVAVKTLGKFPRNLSCDITGIRACVVRKYNSDVSRTWLKEPRDFRASSANRVTMSVTGRGLICFGKVNQFIIRTPTVRKSSSPAQTRLYARQYAQKRRASQDRHHTCRYASVCTRVSKEMDVLTS